MLRNAVALSHLLISERTSLMTLVRRIVGSREAAEDVTQKLYLRVYSIDDEPPILNRKAYLFRLALNAAVDHLRSEKRHTGLNSEIDAILWLEDDSPSPERETLSRMELNRVMKALDSLPEPTREMFRLNRFEGLTQREIASRFGVSTTVVERHIRRALRQLDEARAGE